MDKKVVHFDASKGVTQLRDRALVWPIDHTDTVNVTNRQQAITSRVLKNNPDGSFETLNSIYVPVREEERAWAGEKLAAILTPQNCGCEACDNSCMHD